MIKTLKWIYKLGYNNARAEVFRVLDSAYDLETRYAETKALEEMIDKENNTKVYQVKITPNDHDQRAKAIQDIQNRLDPQRYPNLDRLMELIG